MTETTPSSYNPSPDPMTLSHTLRGHTKEVLSVTWSPNGMWLASGTSSLDAKTEVRIWHGPTGRLLATLPARSICAPFAWHPSLPLLVTAAPSSGDICLWQLHVLQNIRYL